MPRWMDGWMAGWRILHETSLGQGTRDVTNTIIETIRFEKHCLYLYSAGLQAKRVCLYPNHISLSHIWYGLLNSRVVHLLVQHCFIIYIPELTKVHPKNAHQPFPITMIMGS